MSPGFPHLFFVSEHYVMLATGSMEFELHVKIVTAIQDNCHTVKDALRGVNEDILT